VGTLKRNSLLISGLRFFIWAYRKSVANPHKIKKIKINRHSALDAESAGRKRAILSKSSLTSCQAITSR